jgi:hypothetical protein
MTDEGFSKEQMQDIFMKLETSRLLKQMSENLAKEIEEDIKFYNTTNNEETNT